MNIYNLSRQMTSFGGINSCFTNNFVSKVTDQQLRISAVVALALTFLAACCFFIQRYQYNAYENQKLKDELAQAKAQAGNAVVDIIEKIPVAKGKEAILKTKDAVLKTNAKPANGQAVNKSGNDKSASLNLGQLESKLIKKSGIKIIEAGEFDDGTMDDPFSLHAKVIDGVKKLGDVKYLNEQFNGHQYYKNFLAVKEDTNEIVGVLSGEKQSFGRFYVHSCYVEGQAFSPTKNYHDADKSAWKEAERRLFLKAMGKAKELGKQILEVVICADVDSQVDFFMGFKDFNVEVNKEQPTKHVYNAEYDQPMIFHLENFQYDKALEILLNKK